MAPEKIPREMPGMAGTFSAMATITMTGGSISSGLTLKMPAIALPSSAAWLISALPLMPVKPKIRNTTMQTR